MAHYCPGSQHRDVMAAKKAIAIRLFDQGLTDGQISAQLRCSRALIRRLRLAHQAARGAARSDVPA